MARSSPVNMAFPPSSVSTAPPSASTPASASAWMALPARSFCCPAERDPDAASRNPYGLVCTRTPAPPARPIQYHKMCRVGRTKFARDAAVFFFGIGKVVLLLSRAPHPLGKLIGRREVGVV